VESDDYVSFVATDNYRGGVVASERMAAILGRQGSIAVIAALPGAASAVEREQGFKDKLAMEAPQIKIVAFQYGMADRAKSLAVSEDILTAHPELRGIFASNEPSTIGAVQAVKSRGLAGKLKVVGFDTSPSLVDDLRARIIDSLVLQDPFRIGYAGLKLLLDKRAGHDPPHRITLPPVLVTSEQVGAPQFQRLLNPEVGLP
jgi:ribose transport system substrate-binding protein